MIDLRSDTVTLPSDEMYEAVRSAAVGDNACGDDPTVNKLEARVVGFVGKEAALLVPSETMGSQIAARIHADPGQKVLVDEKAHVCEWEVGGFAQLPGLQIRAYDAGECAASTPAQVRDHVREESLHAISTGVLCFEDTHNARGGIVVPKVDVDTAVDAARNLGIPVHLDGAHLFNVCVVLDEDPTAMVRCIDMVMCCLSKGLGAPVGLMFAGLKAFIERAIRAREQLGGGMCQARFIAAPGLVALDNVDHLAGDHANATVLAEGLNAVPGPSVSTSDANIAVVDSEGAGLMAGELVELCDDAGVPGGTLGQCHARFTMSLNVLRADVERVVNLVADMAESR